MSLRQDILDAIDHPYNTALTPSFLKAKSKANLHQILKILMFIDPASLQVLKDQIEALENEADFSQVLPVLRLFLITFGNRDDLSQKLAAYYGLPDDDSTELNVLFHKQVRRPMKIAFNRLSEQFNSDLRMGWSEFEGQDELGNKDHQHKAELIAKFKNPEKNQSKQTTRKMKKVADGTSIALTILVALGQAAISATCFIMMGAASPLFWPIFIAAFTTNSLLLGGDIKGLLRKIGRKITNPNFDFMQGLTGWKKYLAYGSLVFAAASGITLGLMALSTSYGAIMAILPLLGLGVLAIPGVGWAVAAVIAIATVPVMAALMFESMAGFIKAFRSSIDAIKNYFSPSQHLSANANWKQKLTFGLSRALQVVFGLAATAITLFAVISTFGSYTSSISQAIQSLMKVSAKLAHGLSLAVVFICNLIPELVFNFQNVMKFIFQLPTQLKYSFNRAALIFRSDINPVAKVATFLFLATTLFFIGCVTLNGYGNGKTGSTPDGDGVLFLIKLFRFSPSIAAAIGLSTSAGISVAANETYGMEMLNDHTPVAKSGPIAPSAAVVAKIDVSKQPLVNKDKLRVVSKKGTFFNKANSTNNARSPKQGELAAYTH